MDFEGFNVEKTENGNLKLSITDENSKKEILEELENHGFWSTISVLLEPYWTNGSYQSFDAGDANPFVGLSSAICIAELMDYDDDGKASIIGDFWYYNDSAIKCPIEELCEHGEVIFFLAKE